MTDEETVKLISDWGVGNAQACVQASHQEYRPTLARCLALLENESGGRNVFGAEGEACLREWYDQEVTQTRYSFYKLRRNQGLSPNGVGPTQLTDPSLQIAAEKRGGCWIPLHNMEIGFGFLHGLILRYDSVWEGFRAYNGSGPAAESYANRAVERAATWERRLK